eukprot:CAMPEP_0197028002 /NCGR_PEP_ID=MMETSP1384-20130603/7821_1 /TAXON_ID=29189 /ORGANISM="Ammonia sp." /LENGTH=299 /DNA_ID=CAMNT_0042456939 /DNA_START=21 /DNA_END=920 /DNA_ORIENTATION=-
MSQNPELEDTNSFDNETDAMSVPSMSSNPNSNYSAQSAPAAPNAAPNKHKANAANHLAVKNKNSKGGGGASSADEANGGNAPIDLTDNASFNSYDSRGPKSGAEGAFARLNKQERREFMMAFRLFDKDDDGQITVPELQHVFEGLNYHFTQEQLINMLRSIDDNDDGRVDIDEFVYVMKGDAYSQTENSRPFIEELKEAFEVFDKDGDGEITPQELAAIMKALGEDLTEDEIFNMIQEVDQDGDGNIDFNEFKKLMESDHIMGWDKESKDKKKSAQSGHGSKSGQSASSGDDDGKDNDQ